MKIVLSRPEEGQRRHVVLVTDMTEVYEVHPIIYNDVLKREVSPVRERFRVIATGEFMYRYRFGMKYLEALMLTFPHAETSPGLTKRLSKRAMAELNAMQVPEIDIDGLTCELRDYQKIAVGRFMARKYFLLNDEMGLGKTYMALAGIMARRQEAIEEGRDFHAVAIVPNKIKGVWERCAAQITDMDVQVVDGTAAQRRMQIARRAELTIIHVEGMRVKINKIHHRDPEDRRRILSTEEEIEAVHPELFTKANGRPMVYDVAVVDEYHRFKNPDAQQSRGLHRLRARCRWGMSGTPMLNGRPEELWSILHWCFPRRYPDFNAFMSKHCIREGNKASGRVIAYRGLAELKDFWDLRELRRRKDHVLENLPEVVEVTRYVELTAEQRRLYNRIQNEAQLEMDDGSSSDIVSALAQLTRMKQACFSPELYEGSAVSAKIEDLKEIMAELVASGEKAIVFSQWARATRIIERELAQYNPAYLDGSVKSKDVMGQIDKFNTDDDCRVFVGTIGSCKEGFTLSAASYVIFTDEGWVPADMRQAAARSAAGGLRGENSGFSHVHIIRILALDTVEPDIHDLLAMKDRVNNRVIERDGGQQVKKMNMSSMRDILRGVRPAELDAPDEAIEVEGTINPEPRPGRKKKRKRK